MDIDDVEFVGADFDGGVHVVVEFDALVEDDDLVVLHPVQVVLQVRLHARAVAVVHLAQVELPLDFMFDALAGLSDYSVDKLSEFVGFAALARETRQFVLQTGTQVFEFESLSGVGEGDSQL